MWLAWIDGCWVGEPVVANVEDFKRNHPADTDRQRVQLVVITLQHREPACVHAQVFIHRYKGMHTRTCMRANARAYMKQRNYVHMCALHAEIQKRTVDCLSNARRKGAVT